MKIISVFMATMLTACAGTKTIPVAPRIIEVEVPMAVSCITQRPTKPDLASPETLLALPDDEFIFRFHIDRLKRDIYISELEAILQACQ